MIKCYEIVGNQFFSNSSVRKYCTRPKGHKGECIHSYILHTGEIVTTHKNGDVHYTQVWQIK